MKFVLRLVKKGEVLKAISSLKGSKSPGLDNILPGIVKGTAHQIIPSPLHILNVSISTSTIPSEWKIARCVPMFTDRNAKDLDNYSPISVLPAFVESSKRLSIFNCTTSWRITNSCLHTSSVQGIIIQRCRRFFISWTLLERAWIRASSPGPCL